MVTTAASSPFSHQDWELGYATLPDEYSYWIDEIEGTLPPLLNGTLFRNGPGRLGIQEQEYGHPFDGDGMITAFTLTGGRCHFANRFVRTPEYLAEQKAGKILYRGVFGTQKPGGWWSNFFDLNFKNPANTNVIYHGNKLLALWEAAAPYRLDPTTLDTLGRETFGGLLRSNQPFTAHPRVDPRHGHLHAFGVETGLNSKIVFYTLDPQGQLLERREHPVPGFAFLHDFVWTPSHRIFCQNPIGLNPFPFLLGLQPVGTCLYLDPKSPAKLLIFDDSYTLHTLETEAGFVFHHANGYESGEELIFDSVVYDSFPTLDPDMDFRDVNFDQVPAGKLFRFRVNLSRRQVQRHPLLQRTVEFPAIHPRLVGHAHQWVYLGTTHQPTGNAPLQAILKFNVTTGAQEIFSFGPRGYVGEPEFIPYPDATEEDQGWLLTLVFDASRRRSFLAIFAADRLAEGPLAKLHLQHHVPYLLHGMFTPKIFINPEM
jgi:all-trans-8'-apo-beta-carotenal 15,15'-oxygenase